MIIKILTLHSPSYASLIKYILKEGQESHVITHNMRSNTQEGYAQEFLENEALRKHPRKGQIYVYHEIISLSANEDKTAIKDAMLNDLAQKYISLRGRAGMYVGAIHRDNTDHVHIHFCSSGTEFKTGKAFRLSKADLYKLKTSFQNYHLQKYPELTKSTVQHGQGKQYVTDKEWQLQHREDRKLVKEHIRQNVADCFAKAKTQQEFLESLRDNNLHYYERNGVPTGLIHKEMKIRFSRLDILFDRLRPDRTEEEKALETIQRLREQNHNQRNIQLNHIK